MTKTKGNITFTGIELNGKHQDKWFKIFDLLDEIFTDDERENITMTYISCKIDGFTFIGYDLPKGTTKREFAEFVRGEMIDKVA